MHSKLPRAFLVFMAITAAAEAGAIEPVTLTCTSPDPNLRAAILRLDQTQNVVTLTWNDRLLPDGATKPAKEEGTFQAAFSPQNIVFDVDKGNQRNHYVINRQSGFMADERNEIHNGRWINEARYWNCQPPGKAMF